MKLLLLFMFMLSINKAFSEKETAKAVLAGNGVDRDKACDEAWDIAKTAIGRDPGKCGIETLKINDILKQAGEIKGFGCIKQKDIKSKEIFLEECARRYMINTVESQVSAGDIAEDNVKFDASSEQSNDGFQPEISQNARCCKGNKICDASDINSSCNMYESTVQSFGDNKPLMSFFSAFQLMNPFIASSGRALATTSSTFKSRIGTDSFCSGCYKKSFKAMGKNEDDFENKRKELRDKVVNKIKENQLENKLGMLKSAQRNLQAYIALFPEVLGKGSKAELSAKRRDLACSSSKKIIDKIFSQNQVKSCVSFVAKFSNRDFATKEIISKFFKGKKGKGLEDIIGREFEVLKGKKRVRSCGEKDAISPIDRHYQWKLAMSYHGKVKSHRDRVYKFLNKNLNSEQVLSSCQSGDRSNLIKPLLAKESLEIRKKLRGSLYRLIDADPRAALVLTDNKAFCEFYKTASENKKKFSGKEFKYNPAYEYIEEFHANESSSNSTKERFQNYSNNKCEALYSDVANTICSSVGDLGITANDVDIAVNNLGKESSDNADRIVYASLGCSFASKSSTKPSSLSLDKRILINQSHFYDESNQKSYSLSLNQYLKEKEKPTHNCHNHETIASNAGVITGLSIVYDEETGTIRNNSQGYLKNPILNATQAASLSVGEDTYVNHLGYNPTVIESPFGSDSVIASSAASAGNIDSSVASPSSDDSSIANENSLISPISPSQNINYSSAYPALPATQNSISQSDLQSAIVENDDIKERYVKAIEENGKEAVDNYITDDILPNGKEGASLIENNRLRQELEDLKKQIAKSSLENKKDVIQNDNEALASANDRISKLEKYITKLEKPNSSQVENSSSPMNYGQSAGPSFNPESFAQATASEARQKNSTNGRSVASVVAPPVANMPDLSLKQVASGAYTFTFSGDTLFLTSKGSANSYPLGLSNLTLNGNEVVSVRIRGTEIPFERLTVEQRAALTSFVEKRDNARSELADLKKQKVIMEKRKEQASADATRYAQMLNEFETNAK